MDEAQGVVAPFAELLDRLSEAVGGRAHVRAVFGDRVDVGRVTVIPVAGVVGAFGIGADTSGKPTAPDGSPPGTGQKRSRAHAGFGGGGGFVALPMGFIEIESGRARFRRLDQGVARFVGGKTGLALELASRGLRHALVVLRERRLRKRAASAVT